MSQKYLLSAFAGIILFMPFVFTSCGGEVSSILEDAEGRQKFCKNSAQCAKDEVCENNVCVKRDGGFVACRNSSDCNSDEECINSVCQKKVIDACCGEDVPGDDIAPVEALRCNYNSECPDGFICNTETHSCVPGGRIKVDPEKLEFGSVKFGQSVTKSVLVTNVGNGPLTIYLIDFESNTNPDPDHPRFTKTTDKNIPVVLSPNDTLNISVTYKQDDENPDNGFLVINSSDITNPSVKVLLYSRYKGNPDLVIVDRSTTPPRLLYPQAGATSSYAIDLGNIPVGETKEMLVTLYNQADEAIVAIKGMKITQFSKNKIDIELRSPLDENIKYTAPFYISAGEMVDLYIKYTPQTKESNEHTQLFFSTNDPDINNDYIEGDSDLTINILGQAGYVPPGISVDKSMIDFSEVQVGLVAEEIFHITNTGGENLVIDQSSGFDNQNTDFSMSPSKLGGTLPAGSELEVKVKFAPQSTGAQFNKIVIKSNDTNNPVVEVRLYGIGTDPNLVISPDQDIDFGIVEVGKESDAKSFSIYNSGKGSLVINSIGLSAGSSNDFILLNLPQFPYSIRGDGQDVLQVDVKFRPSVSSDPNPIRGAIEIKTNDKDNQVKYINLVGIGFKCPPGFSDCNNDMSDKCETDVDNSVDNCGFCSNKCIVDHGTPRCSKGKCEIASCDQFWADCDKLYNNGCETSTQNDINNCGACGLKCSVLNGSPKCNNGICEIDKCYSPYKDCKNGYADGCETNTNTDVNNCGSCGNKCSAPNATSRCSNGYCMIDKCDNGFKDCDALYSNGCEIYIAGDPNNCGECGRICNLPNATSKCLTGSCVVDTCIGDYRDCDGKSDNGCEIDIASDVNNCGFCGYVCSLNNAQAKCVNKSCAIDYCIGTYGDCNGNVLDGCETDTSNNINHCGRCNNKCTVNNGTPKCENGVCGILSCNTGYKDCKNGYADGCETNVASDVNNCGDCGRSCVVPPYVTSVGCQNGGCIITACYSNYYDIDGLYSNGCECKQDDNDINNQGNTAATAIDLGTLHDSAKQYVMVTNNNIVPTNDVDWYKVTAEDDSTSGYNNFDFIVEIVGCNPYTPDTCEFQFEVYKDVVDNNHKVCSNDVKYEFTVNFRQDVDGDGKNEGENPCTASCASNDYVNNCCHSYTATYYIKVFRRAGASPTCNTYTLKITNGS